MAEKLLRTLGERWNPVKCTPYKDNLDHTPRRKEANIKAGDGPNLYNPDVTEKKEPEKAIRIFLKELKEGEESLKPVYRKNTYPQKQWTLYTDGACLEGSQCRNILLRRWNKKPCPKNPRTLPNKPKGRTNGNSKSPRNNTKRR